VVGRNEQLASPANTHRQRREQRILRHHRSRRGRRPLGTTALAEHFCQIKDVQNDGDGQNAGAQPDPVSAYTWYLLAEKTAAPILEQIAEGKKNISGTMSPQQLEEAEGRAAAWSRNTKKQSGFAGSDEVEVQTGGQEKKIRTSGR
jgi:hypothetical protein